MQTRTVQVGHLSDLASEREIHEFFSFSGDIERIEIQSGSGQPRTAFVTFKDPKALEIALLLSGATIVDQVVSISPVENYIPKAEDLRIEINTLSVAPAENASQYMEARSTSPINGRVYVAKAQDVVTSMLAKGSAMKQDAVNKAKAFDEKHRLTASASEKVIAFDRRVGLTDKLIAAERKLNDTGSAVKTSRYVTAGAAWLNGAFSKVAKAGQVAGTKTREKFHIAVSNLTAKDSPIAV